MVAGISRRKMVSTVVGIAAATALTGLALPFVLGEPVDDRPQAVGMLDAAPPDDVLGGDTMTTATNDGGGAPAGAVTPTTAAGGVTPRAADRTAPGTVASSGVTGSGEIKIGIMLLDLGGAGRLGFGSFAGVDPEQQRRAFQIYVDDVNAHGGINGAVVKPVFATFDVLSQDSRRAACLQLTEDEQVFAVLATPGYQGPPTLCVTVEHGTPMVNADFLPSDYLDRSAGRLVSFQQGSTRMMRNWVAELDAAGAVRSKVIGVAGQEYPWTKLAVEQGLLPALEQAGYEVAYRARLSGDLSTAASQVPIEVQQMRSRGVDTVLLMTDAVVATQFVQTATSQSWAPTWQVSDWHGLSQDWGGSNMPAAFEGATGVTSWRTGEWRVGGAAQPQDRWCQQLYERGSGESLPRTKDDAENSTYNVTIIACGLVQVFARAARSASPLTRESLVASVQRLGPVELPNQLGGSYAPGKVDAADLVRTVSWKAGCSCWMPVDAPRASRH